MNRDRVAGVVVHQGKILLMFRRNHGKEYFTFPGGGIDAGEREEQALIRELREETSVSVRPERRLCTIEWDMRSFQRFYLATYVAGVPELGDFVEKEVMRTDPNQYYDPQWRSLDEFPDLLVYPLEIRDWLADAFRGQWPDAELFMQLELRTCRQ